MDVNLTQEDIEQVGELENSMEQKMLEIGQRQFWRQKEASRIAKEEVPEYFHNGETRQEALWRTLLCNRSLSSFPAEESCKRDFQDFFRIMENAPKILSGDNNMAFEGQLGMSNASDDIRDEISKVEGYGNKATPEETIDTIQKLMDATGVAVDIRQYLTAELLIDRPRLTKELVILADISAQNAAVLIQAEKSFHIGRNEVTPEWKQALEELCVKGLSLVFTPDPLQLIRKSCLMYGWLWGMVGVKISDKMISIIGTLTREQERVKCVLYEGRFGALVASTMAQRQFAITDMGYMAMVPRETKHGDVVCVFLGARTPHILRKVAVSGTEQKYQLVGEAYVHQFMDGQALMMYGDRN